MNKQNERGAWRTARPGCALITGASQGLGRAFAEECAGRGMSLVLVALPDTGLPEVASVLVPLNSQALPRTRQRSSSTWRPSSG